jgi:hypothetical protein
MSKAFAAVEGHNSTDELVGSAWVEAGTGAVAIMKEFIDRDEPFSTEQRHHRAHSAGPLAQPLPWRARKSRER